MVGHDWGAYAAWHLGLFRGDKVKGLVALSVAFMPRNPAMKTLDFFRTLYGDDHYICRFQVFLLRCLPYDISSFIFKVGEKTRQGNEDPLMLGPYAYVK